MTQIPWSMVESFEHFLKSVAGEDHHFMIRPRWSHNYSIAGDLTKFYRNLICSCSWIPDDTWDAAWTTDLLPEGDDPNHSVFSISFPRLERLNCLSHVTWGHEIGHILAAKWDLDNFTTLWADVQSGIRLAIEEGVSQNPPKQFQPKFKKTAINNMVSHQFERTMEILRQGLKELICDAVGLHLLGPALLAECCEYTAVCELDESPLKIGGYPPWRFRIRTMFEACKNQLVLPTDGDGPAESEGALGPYLAWLREVEYLVAGTTDMLAMQNHVITREAYRVINERWNDIRGEAIAYLPNEFTKAYDITARAGELAQLVAKLRLDIPPNEIGQWPDTTPASLADILNAGWAHKIAMMKTGGATQENYDKMSRLLLKGIEASFITKKYGPKLLNL